MGKNRILCQLLGITQDTNEISGDTTPMPKSHRILDYVKDIADDTNTIVETGGGGGGGCDCEECTDSEIIALFG